MKLLLIDTSSESSTIASVYQVLNSTSSKTRLSLLDLSLSSTK